MATSDFYDELDLRYPEIAICLDTINRLNPGSYRFIVPVLTPTMNTSSASQTTIRQTATNIQNKNTGGLNISNLDISNYITIKIPTELVTVPYYTESVDASSAVWHLYGSVPPFPYGTAIGYGDFSAKVAYTSASETTIPAGSKWIVVFIGGDINKPQIIGRYTE